MFQVFFRGSLTVAWFELRGARLLFARSMQPKLDEPDRDSHELRYLNWYHKSDPLKVEGNRRLNAWQSRRGQIAVGVGVNATISGMSKVFELGVFVLVLVGEDERGFLIVGEVFALSSTTPVGYIALEWDGKNDRFSMLIGVDVVIRNFLAKAPAFINNLGRITGTLFISNDPGTVALGRLADQRTWLGLRFDVQFLGQRQLLEFALCFEHIDRPTGPKGFGLLVRIEGAIDLVVAQLEYHAGLGALIATFTTGSTDYAILLYIEVGLRIVLIRFLRFGIDLRV
jgi:hypothetical protein